MRAWIYQDAKQVKKNGANNSSFFVGWYDPSGRQKCKSCGRGTAGRREAEKLRRRIEGQLAAGTYQDNSRKSWQDFREEFERVALGGKRSGTRTSYKHCLDNFQRLAKPVRMHAITSKVIADYVAARRLEDGVHKGLNVTVATINKELRHIRAALRKAHKWGYLPLIPAFEFEKEPKKLPTYVSDEHFLALYNACTAAKEPQNLPNGITTIAWWQALLVTAFMTGWRIGSLLSLKWVDLDLDAGTAVSLSADNKGDRDQLVPLHPLVVEHLTMLKGAFGTFVFPWSRNRRALYVDFFRVQDAAGVKPLRKPQYGFHDLRRGFATYNADRMSADALQVLMQHKDHQTTQRYINLAHQLKPAAANLFVPSVLKEEKKA